MLHHIICIKQETETEELVLKSHIHTQVLILHTCFMKHFWSYQCTYC